MKKLIAGAVDAAKSLQPSEVKKDPAKAAGTVVGAGVAALGHPWLAVAAGAATEKLVTKAMPAIKTRTDHLLESIDRSRQ